MTHLGIGLGLRLIHVEMNISPVALLFSLFEQSGWNVEAHQFTYDPYIHENAVLHLQKEQSHE